MDGLNNSLEAMLTGLVDSLPKIIAALVVFFLTLLIAGLVARAAQRAMNKRGAEEQITILLGKLIRWGIIVLGTALALEQVDFDLTAFLAGLGIVGFTVGFAIQDVSKNFVAGLLLLLQQPFDLGDTIKVGEFHRRCAAGGPAGDRAAHPGRPVCADPQCRCVHQPDYQYHPGGGAAGSDHDRCGV